MELTNDFDVSLLSYEEWIDYFFGQRLLNPDDAEREPFSKEPEFFINAFCPQGHILEVSRPEKIVEYLTRLCDGFSELGKKYSLPQLNQGIWAIIGPAFALGDLLWKPTIPLADRLICIRSMRRPYIDYVDGHDAPVMENCFSMWFDMVLGWRESYTDLAADERSLLDTFFETLCAILELNDERCQSYALHGLGHLCHPARAARVQQFIDAHQGEDLNLEWLHECRDGTVM